MDSVSSTVHEYVWTGLCVPSMSWSKAMVVLTSSPSYRRSGSRVEVSCRSPLYCHEMVCSWPSPHKDAELGSSTKIPGCDGAGVVGAGVGADVGTAVGSGVGAGTGQGEGAGMGKGVGEALGPGVGSWVGPGDGCGDAAMEKYPEYPLLPVA